MPLSLVSSLFWLKDLITARAFSSSSYAQLRLTKIDEMVRFVVIPVLLIVSIWSLLGDGPLPAGPGQKWYALKMLLNAGTLMIGLKLRFIMREWTELFRKLAVGGDNASIESTLERSIRFGRTLAYFYWITILTVAFLGAVKPL
jgi:hypothetical protein